MLIPGAGTELYRGVGGDRNVRHYWCGDCDVDPVARANINRTEDLRETCLTGLLKLSLVKTGNAHG